MRESYFSCVKKEKAAGNISSKDKDYIGHLEGNTFCFLQSCPIFFIKTT